MGGVGGVLLLLDADGPDGGLLAGQVFLFGDVGVFEADDADGEHAEGEELEGLFGGGAVGDSGEEWLFGAGLGVGG